MSEAGKAERIRLGAKRQLTLPQKAAAKLRLNAGDYLELRIREDRIELIPLTLVPRDQAWFWTPEWQQKEKKADKAVASRRYKEHDSAEKAISHLKS